MIEQKACVYWITYSGDKHPKNYIGSVYTEKISQGYMGSCSSKKWADIVKKEQKEHPWLYTVKIIHECDTREDAGIMEGLIQKMYNVVNSDDFWNMCISHNGHIYTCRKGIEPWNKGKRGVYSEKTLNQMSESKKGVKFHTPESKKLLKEINTGELNAFYGKHHTEELKAQWRLDRKGTQKGDKNRNAKSINIYNENGVLQYSCFGNFIDTCKLNNLPSAALGKSYRNNGEPLYQSQSPQAHIQERYKQFKGWYAVFTKPKP